MPPLCDMSLVTVPVSLVCAITNGMLWVCEAHFPRERSLQGVAVSDGCHNKL